MIKHLTKGEIDRLGNKIREQKPSINDKVLQELQRYRTSHKECLADTFNSLCNHGKRIHATTIVTFRVKRFESIIGKLERYPEMRFSRMGDIAGCRCIVRNDNDVYKLESLIENDPQLTVIKKYDYIKEPQSDGYRSLHLFVQSPDCKYTVEVQIRNTKNHNWATLVEISDLLFDSKLKEYGKDKKLLRFHFLLSEQSRLTIKEKNEIAKIIQEYSYIEKLSEIFARNYLRVRKQWYNLTVHTTHKYFLIETKIADVPKLESFRTFQEAEDAYFNVYKTTNNANIVLTHLQQPSYELVSIAYSNYILTFHSFLFESLEILRSLIVESLYNRKYRSFISHYNLYHRLILSHSLNLVSEIREAHSYSIESKQESKHDKKKEKEWIKHITTQIEKTNAGGVLLQKKIKEAMPFYWIEKFVINQVIKKTHKRYNRRLSEILDGV